MLYLIKIVSISLSLFLTTGVLPSEANAQGKALFQKKCNLCHSLDMAKARQRDLKEWKATIDRMKGNGSDVTDQQAKLIAEYLSSVYGTKTAPN